MSNILAEDTLVWHLACSEADIPENGGACALIEGEQIAIYNFKRREKDKLVTIWF